MKILWKNVITMELTYITFSAFLLSVGYSVNAATIASALVVGLFFGILGIPLVEDKKKNGP